MICSSVCQGRSFAEPVLSGRCVSKNESRSFAALRMTRMGEGLRMTELVMIVD